MKESNFSNPEDSKQKRSLFLIPDDILDNLVAKQDRILELLEAKREATFNGYVSEKKAMEQLNKKATWFWQMRKTGQIPFKKIGKTIYYSVDDLRALLTKK